jgi:hypothetical protein
MYAMLVLTLEEKRLFLVLCAARNASCATPAIFGAEFCQKLL